MPPCQPLVFYFSLLTFVGPSAWAENPCLPNNLGSPDIRGNTTEQLDAIEADMLESPDCSRFKPRAQDNEKFDKLKNHLTQAYILDGSKPSASFVLIGKAKTPVLPFKEVQSIVTAEEYFRYLSLLVDSPQDASLLINTPFQKWKEPHSVTRPPEQVLQDAGGDCDELSWFAKRILDAVGCKNGFNLKAKVIGLNNHAVCIFTDEKDKKYSIDQWEMKEIHHISEASEEFRKPSDPSSPKNQFIQVKQYSAEATLLKIEIDSERLIPTRDRMIALLSRDRVRMEKVIEFDPTPYLPASWKGYGILELHSGENTLFYQSGQLYQVNRAKDQIIEYFKDKKIIQRSFAHGDVETESFENGDLVERVYRKDSKAEFSFDVLKNGVLVQRTFSNGTVELYNPKSGKLEQKTFPENQGDIKALFFDDLGRAIQINRRDGTIDLLDPATGNTVKKRKAINPN